ncbi:MAG TPA: hypothetical protein VK660_04285, partial [Xanthomonadaceae bacterium]|nr:hypothetical protein [Xanthomonadaceae bacterium]
MIARHAGVGYLEQIGEEFLGRQCTPGFGLGAARFGLGVACFVLSTSSLMDAHGRGSQLSHDHQCAERNSNGMSLQELACAI